MNDNSTPVLPPLSDATIARMERSVFDSIGDARAQDVTRAKRRRKRTLGWSTAAAVVVVLSVAFVPGLISAGTASNVAQHLPDNPVAPNSTAEQQNGAIGESAANSASGGAADGKAQGLTLPVAPAVGTANRAGGAAQVIENASVTLRVDDVASAAERVSSVAAVLQGYVSSQNIGNNKQTIGMAEDAARSKTVEPNYGWISIRVPQASLQNALDRLAPIGEVTGSSIDRTDVTQQSVDLTARVDSLTASVSRLQQLMSQAANVADLISAETALTERQAELDSLKQQLAGLKDQVSMSTISINLEQKSTVKANPVGFGDGLANGWNSIVATFNALVVAAGFALPWLVPFAVIAIVVWLIVRSRRRRNDATEA